MKARLPAVALLVLSLSACGSSAGDLGDTPGDGDVDGDGHTPGGGDCDDGNAGVHPGAGETCDDGVDNDCDGSADRADTSCMTPCERSAVERSSVGCVYYAVDTNAMGGPYAVAVSNVDAASTANVVIEQKVGGVYAPVAGGALTVPPRSLQSLVMPRLAVTGSSIIAGGAFRITSDLPLIAYQFAPIDGSASYLSDASLLLPTSALDTYYLVPAWPRGAADDCTAVPSHPSHVQIAATTTTTVTVTSPTATQGGLDVPALPPGMPRSFSLEEGDVLQIDSAGTGATLDGLYVEASAPVAVFSSNDCANVPDSCAACCCEHLEEQIFGLQTWGTSYVGAQMPRRAAESAIWHVLAQDDATIVTFSPAPGVTGLPAGPVVLAAREKLSLEVSGGAASGADFLVTSDKPIHLNQYTVGALYAGSGFVGDPDMVQAVPTEQYLTSYVVLVPGTWVNDFLVLTRKSGTEVLVDGTPVTAGWTEVAAGWEAARVPVADGVHTIDGLAPVGVSVSGYDEFDSYSYPGGLDQQVINPVE